ncbi:hypothetical protein [Actinoplanes teichomyceticus]|uniref:hypothetical protein n=1 Tax=Actinoplanes teichomyceticus TaxID=1867 RepID=UPI00119FE2EE|nr:hypothetical protein [Actinoplanes teichomyceticus]
MSVVGSVPTGSLIPNASPVPAGRDRVGWADAAGLGADLFVVVEDDMCPSAFHLPLPIAAHTRGYPEETGDFV